MSFNIRDSYKHDSNYNPTTRVEAYSPLFLDAFGRQRVSQPYKLFAMDLTQELDENRYFAKKEVGAGTVSHVPLRSSVKLTTTTASGDKAILKSRRAIAYIKGSSHLLKFTGCFSAGKTNLKQTYGYFDNNNGTFIQINGTTPCVGYRSDVSGSVVDTTVNQSSWNYDPMDGTGPSGKTYDYSTQTLYMVDLGWLGSHAIRFFIDIENVFYLVHEFKFSNVLTAPYMRTATLPIRAEIENIGTTSSTSNMYVTCGSVEAEGSHISQGIVRTYPINTTPISLSTTPALIAGMRLDPNNINANIEITSYALLPTSGNDIAYYEIIYNPTLVGATWADAPDGIAELLTAITSWSGGSVIYSGFFPTDNKNRIVSAINTTCPSDVRLGSDVDGNPDAVIMVAATVSGTAGIVMEGSYREVT